MGAAQDRGCPTLPPPARTCCGPLPLPPQITPLAPLLSSPTFPTLPVLACPPRTLSSGGLRVHAVTHLLALDLATPPGRALLREAVRYLADISSACEARVMLAFNPGQATLGGAEDPPPSLLEALLLLLQNTTLAPPAASVRNVVGGARGLHSPTHSLTLLSPTHPLTHSPCTQFTHSPALTHSPCSHPPTH